MVFSVCAIAIFNHVTTTRLFQCATGEFTTIALKNDVVTIEG